MEVIFLDVGQGSASVVLLGNGQALLIDAGSQGTQLVRTLGQFGVSSIPAIFLTHSHDDHVGSMLDVLEQYAGRIGEVFLQDDGNLLQTKLWCKLEGLIDRGELDERQLVSIVEQKDSKRLFVSDNGECEIAVLAPTLYQNLRAVKRSAPNATSAILRLRYSGYNAVVFGGDADIRLWNYLQQKVGGAYHCEVLTVPHHGGDAFAGDFSFAASFYTDIVRTSYAIISVGTSNSYGHPRREVVEAIVNSGAKLLCTQVTESCCSGRLMSSLRSKRAGIAAPHSSSLSAHGAISTVSGNPANLACAGTVIAKLQAGGVKIEQFELHQQSISECRHSEFRPVCRLA